MRFDTQVIYPHPVLRPDVEDYVDGEFQAVIENINVSSDQANVSITVSYTLSVPEIEELVTDGVARVGLLINCRDTFYREIFEIPATGSTVISIDGGLLHGEVVVVPIVYASQPITGFTSKDFAEEFEGQNFNLKPGDFLAYEEPEIFYLEREAFAPIESIIRLNLDQSRTGYEWDIGLETDSIEIIVSPELGSEIQKARNNPQNIVTLINSIYFSAIQAAVEYLKHDTDDLDKKWANVIRQKSLAHGIADIRHEDTFRTTQRLLRHPIQKLTKSMFASEI
jgi:hypothetical protein